VVFGKGDEGAVGDMAYRLTGSPDLYEHHGRRPYASVNFVTVHDGFTLTDLVSYNEKHNELNNDKTATATTIISRGIAASKVRPNDPQINALRDRQRRNFLTTLFLSQGVPMLCGGDEWGRTQNGNNNAYCQDNEISWFNWERDEKQNQFFEFTRKIDTAPKRTSGFSAPEVLKGRRIPARKFEM
jgi:glycogen operon protein